MAFRNIDFLAVFSINLAEVGVLRGRDDILLLATAQVSVVGWGCGPKPASPDKGPPVMALGQSCPSVSAPR